MATFERALARDEASAVELRDRVGGWCGGEEDDGELRDVGLRAGVGMARGYGAQLLRGTHDDGDCRAEAVAEGNGNRLCDGDLVGALAREENIAALHVSRDVGVAERLEEGAQVGHQDFVVAADVDAAQQRDVGGWHPSIQAAGAGARQDGRGPSDGGPPVTGSLPSASSPQRGDALHPDAVAPPSRYAGFVSDLRILSRPELRRPLLITAFAGWNDAGESATGALRFMRRRWRSEPIAEIDPEHFFDFTQARPRVRLEKGERVLDWPKSSFVARRVEGGDRDIVLLEAIEPHLAWGRYIETVREFCREFDVSGVVTLGALLAEVSHARPVRVTGTSPDEELRELIGVDDASGARYEGPTGIVGVLNQAIRAAGMPTASLWANVPYYVNASPNPKGALGLVQRLNDGLALDLSLHDMEVFAARFDAQVSAEIEKDGEMSALAEQIERQQDAEEDGSPRARPAESELPDAATMVEDLEHFLREQREDPGS